MDKYFKNSYGGVEIPDFSTPDLSKYRFISTTAQGNQTYRRETPKHPTKQQKAYLVRYPYRSLAVRDPKKPNILNKYERRAYKRQKAWIDRWYPF
jgi:hypothetical protein